MVKNMAYFKACQSKTSPYRPGPIQCVRNCTTCIVCPILDDDPDAEEIIAVESYADLNILKPSASSRAPFQAIQYNLGQVDVLKRSINKLKPKLILYVVASSRLVDINYFRAILAKERLSSCKIIDSETALIKDDGQIRSGQFIAPIHLRSCPIVAEDRMLTEMQLRNLIKPLVKLSIDHANDETSRVILVPVAVSKDHDITTTAAMGSICAQIIEPYSLEEYLDNLKTEYKAGHLVRHLWYDLTLHGARLPAQVVAFLILYLDRPQGVPRLDLIDYMDWLKESSMEFSLHLTFTGSSDKAVELALLVLRDYIQEDSASKTFKAINNEALKDYASPIVTNFVYYGVISRAILMLRSNETEIWPHTTFSSDQETTVMKDDLLELSQDLAESIDTMLPCRRPCADVQTCVVDVFERMQTFGHYFMIQEARVSQSRGKGWCGDYDSDDEYFWSMRDDPAFKPWIILTRRPYRLDRLNLFVNAVDPYLVSARGPGKK